VLGAGLDTYAYRSPFGERLRIFEVIIRQPSLEGPSAQRGVYTDTKLANIRSHRFERDTLSEGLTAARFDPSQRTFFTWLAGTLPHKGSYLVDAWLHRSAAERRRSRIRLQRSSRSLLPESVIA